MAFDAAHRTLDAIAAVLSASEVPGSSPALAPRAPEVQPPASTEATRPPLPAKETSHAEPARAVPALAEVLLPAAEPKTSASGDTVRISVAKLDAQLVEAEEMLTAKLTMGQRAADLRQLGSRFEEWRKEWTAVEPEAQALRHALARPAPARASQLTSPGVVRLLEFFEWNLHYLRALESNVTMLAQTAEHDRYVIGKLVDDLLEDSKKLLLLPFATLAASFPRVVRDLCRDLGKEADLVVRGEEVEIDKRILEEMKDPLIHALRNCVDHGVEAPEVRARLGKPVRATITLAVSQLNGSKVSILVSDDGAGIDAEKVRESAIKHGLLSVDDARQLSDAKARDLIFHDGISTSPIITRLSGRGLGMAIVREKAEMLGGGVSVESQPGQGTSIHIELPSMLASFRGVLVEAEGRVFVVPTADVERVVRVKADDVQTVEGREAIVLGGRAVAFVRLADVLELPSTGEASDTSPVLVLGLGDQRVGFAVGTVLDEQEVLVKPLRKPLARVRNVAGATVLGSGQVAPILNVADLLKSARNANRAEARVAGGAQPRVAEAKSVLAADDSATSRMLIKSMLESGGYKVTMAVDGMEAFTLLRTGHFDLLVSDVEMPRLNGFDLTAKVRADRKLAELPVVLVTARETREDRERGIDAGANAYIVKSSLDQSNLLDAVRRLL